MNNLWPVIDELKATDDIVPFFDETIDALKEHYDGKIQAQYCQIEYILKGIHSAVSSIVEMSNLVGKPQNNCNFEEKKDIEKDRKQVVVSNKDYKYEIFNDHLYYKLFTINIPEFYPVKISVSAGILDKDNLEMEISNLDDLKSVFSRIVWSEKVKMIISKMVK